MNFLYELKQYCNSAKIKIIFQEIDYDKPILKSNDHFIIFKVKHSTSPDINVILWYVVCRVISIFISSIYVKI